MKIDFTIETQIKSTPRTKQLSAIFDIPKKTQDRIRFCGELPIENMDWNVGLIVGPSGCGKSTLLKSQFGEPTENKWSKNAVIDDFSKQFSIEEISNACSSVGFNTLPAWLRPYSILSNGEKFRIDLARRILESKGTIVVDEFTSVVDRQVAKIASHAVAKYIRKGNRQFVAASCHYDIVEWLQPDWILEPEGMRFTRRGVDHRPFCQAVLAEYPAPRGNGSVAITI